MITSTTNQLLAMTGGGGGSGAEEQPRCGAPRRPRLPGFEPRSYSSFWKSRAIVKLPCSACGTNPATSRLRASIIFGFVSRTHHVNLRTTGHFQDALARLQREASRAAPGDERKTGDRQNPGQARSGGRSSEQGPASAYGGSVGKLQDLKGAGAIGVADAAGGQNDHPISPEPDIAAKKAPGDRQYPVQGAAAGGQGAAAAATDGGAGVGPGEGREVHPDL